MSSASSRGPFWSLPLEELEVTERFVGGYGRARSAVMPVWGEGMENGELIERKNSDGKGKRWENEMAGDEKAVQQSEQISKQRKRRRQQFYWAEKNKQNGAWLVGGRRLRGYQGSAGLALPLHLVIGDLND